MSNAFDSTLATALGLGVLIGGLGSRLLLLWGRSVRRRARARAAAALMEGVDPLTGLRTVDRLVERLEHDLGESGRVTPAAALQVGLDGFRILNDSHGTGVGDEVLKAVAELLVRRVGERGEVFRMDGDQFLLWLLQPPQVCEDLARELVERAMADVHVDGLPVPLSVSVGVAMYPQHGAVPLVLSRAAAALRHVKRNGGAAHAVFDPVIEAAQKEEQFIARELRHAIARDQLELFYQPKVEATSLQVTAVEALLRWKHPSLGMVSPAKFIPVAEKHGLIAMLGQWVLETALAQAARWRGDGLRMRVAINVSGSQMRHEEFAHRLERGLAEHGLVPNRFTCEVTESVAMEDTQVTRKAFERLRQVGVHVSIDDFGTGHSSLALLRRLPAGELKVDRAFVQDIEHSDAARKLVGAIIAMARTLDLRVVAEGVETAGQRDLLVQLGCDELQGYLFAKPMNARAITLWAMDGPQHLAAQGFRPSLFSETRPMD